MMERRTFIQHALVTGLILQQVSVLSSAQAEDKPAETNPAPADKPAETNPAPTDKPAETNPAPADKPVETNPAPTDKPAETALTTPAADPFEAKNLDDALQALGITKDKPAEKSKEITLKAPELAESGAIIPLTITTTHKNVKEIMILVADNPRPLTAIFTLPEGTEASIATRIRMDKSSEIIALVKTDEKIWQAKQAVKVSASGCEG